MDLTPMIDGLNKQARANQARKESDWRDDKGLLHCGICGEPLEHLLFSRKDPKPLDADMDYETKLKIEETRNLLRGKKVACICKCAKRDREKLEHNKRENERRERRFNCFGNSMSLANITFETDNREKPKLSDTMNRYVFKFSEIRQNGNCIIFSGDHNTGKTFYTIAIANALIDKGYEVSHSSVHKINSMISPYVTVQHVINTQLYADLVIIEDVNEDCMVGKNYQTLTNFICTVQSRNIPIIITTNFKGQELENIRQICKKSSVVNLEEL